MSAVCSACGDDSKTPHFDADPSTGPVCCECFQDRFPFHDACTHDACEPGTHSLEWDRTTFVCAECGVSTQTLTDHLGHDLTPDMSDSTDADADADAGATDTDTGDTEVEDVEEQEDTPDQATLAAFGEVTA